MKKISFLAFSVLFILIFSCSNSYDEVIENYNRKYFKEEPADKRTYSIETGDFEQTEMLADSYELKNGMTFSLTAPEGGVTYLWTALVPDATDKKKDNQTEIGNEKDLIYRMPGVFRDDAVNKLVLTVTDAKGNEYKDTTLIIIE